MAEFSAASGRDGGVAQETGFGTIPSQPASRSRQSHKRPPGHYAGRPFFLGETYADPYGCPIAGSGRQAFFSCASVEKEPPNQNPVKKPNTPATVPMASTIISRFRGNFARFTFWRRIDPCVSSRGSGRYRKQNPCRENPAGVSPVDDERRTLTHGGSSRTVSIR
jgi:hypothetical protein